MALCQDKQVAFTMKKCMNYVQSKVMVGFPQCDTNPARAGEYCNSYPKIMESMLSRCVMWGGLG
jgi:hypothetical protein